MRVRDMKIKLSLHLFLYAENKVAFTRLLIHFDVLVGEYTRFATKKLLKWVSETSEETRSLGENGRN